MEAADRPGLLASLRRLFGDVAELGQVRLELFATELQQEKLRVYEALSWLALAVLAAGLGLVLLDALIVLLVAEPYRLAAIGVLVLLHVVGAIVAWRIGRARLREGVPFEASVAELRRDRAALAGRSPPGPP